MPPAFTTVPGPSSATRLGRPHQQRLLLAARAANAQRDIPGGVVPAAVGEEAVLGEHDAVAASRRPPRSG